MPERRRLECEVLQKARYINTLTFTFNVPWCEWHEDMGATKLQIGFCVFA